MQSRLADGNPVARTPARSLTDYGLIESKPIFDPGYMDGEVGTATDSERVRIRQDNRCSLGTWTTGVRGTERPGAAA